MIRKVDDVEKGTNNACTLGGNQEMWLLTEDGMYEVLMQSQKPKREEIKQLLKQIRCSPSSEKF